MDKVSAIKHRIQKNVNLLHGIIDNTLTNRMSVKDAFKIYLFYKVDLAIIIFLAMSHDLTVDENGFQLLLKEHEATKDKINGEQ